MKQGQLARLLELHRRRTQARESELSRARSAHEQLLDQRRRLNDHVEAKHSEKRQVDQRLLDQTSSLALKSGVALCSQLRAQLTALEHSEQDISDRIQESDDILSGCVRRLIVGQEREALFSEHLSRLLRSAIEREESESEALHIEHQYFSNGGTRSS